MPIKIAYLAQSSLISDSANSVHVMRMCDAFTRLGHGVALHAMQGTGDVDEVYDHYGVQERFAVRRYLPDASGMASGLLALQRRLPAMRVGQIPNLCLGWKPVKKSVEEAAPDLIYARNLDWLWGVRRHRAGFVLECHAPPVNALARWMTRRLVLRPNCRGLVVISQALKEIYLQMIPDIPRGRIIVAHDGADLPAVRTGDYPTCGGRPVVGYVGHLYAGRGGNLMLDLARRLPEAEFHFVGGRPEDIDRLKQSGKPENATFHGHMSPAQLPSFYGIFDIVLAPYQKRVSVHGNAGDTSAFMSPLKIFEYMAWAKPIVASDMPALQEILRDGENALLVAPDDVADWESAVRRLISEPALGKHLGANALRDLEDNYTWTRRAEIVLETAQTNAAHATA